MTNLIGKPYLAKYGQAGDIKWISHILHGVNYVLASDKIVAVNHREPVRETRVYRIVGNTLVHEDTFGSQVYPLLVRGDTVILTNNKVVSSYSME